jgi:hypothetical protein
MNTSVDSATISDQDDSIQDNMHMENVMGQTLEEVWDCSNELFKVVIVNDIDVLSLCSYSSYSGHWKPCRL